MTAQTPSASTPGITGVGTSGSFHMQTCDGYNAGATGSVMASPWRVDAINHLTIDARTQSGTWGTAVFTVKASIDGTNWTTLAIISAAGTTRGIEVSAWTHIQIENTTTNAAALTIQFMAYGFIVDPTASVQLAQARPVNTDATSFIAFTCEVDEIIVCEQSGTARTFRIFNDVDGTTADQTTAIFYDVAIKANQTIILRPPKGRRWLNVNGSWYVRSSANSALTFTAYGRR